MAKPRHRREQDSYGRRAQKEGFRARSVYKLEEIDRRTQLLRRGFRVLDLGAAPGSWTQYTSSRVGLEGYVFAIDLQPIEVTPMPHVEIHQGDAWKLRAEDFKKPFDVALSDMAPRTSGNRAADQYKSFELVMRAHDIATRVLRPGGSFVAKIFQGAEFDDARDVIRKHFEKLRILRPEATRDESYEVFLVATNFLGAPTENPWPAPDAAPEVPEGWSPLDP